MWKATSLYSNQYFDVRVLGWNWNCQMLQIFRYSDWWESFKLLSWNLNWVSFLETKSVSHTKSESIWSLQPFSSWWIMDICHSWTLQPSIWKKSDTVLCVLWLIAAIVYITVLCILTADSLTGLFLSKNAFLDFFPHIYAHFCVRTSAIMVCALRTSFWCRSQKSELNWVKRPLNFLTLLPGIICKRI